MYVYYHTVPPFRALQKHRESLRRLEKTVAELAQLRPSEFTTEEWSYIIGWTQNALGNCCGFAEAITDAEAFKAFSYEAERRTGTESAIQTVDWMWGQLEILSKYGPEYSARHRPTSEDRLKEAPHVKIGPPVP